MVQRLSSRPPSRSDGLTKFFGIDLRALSGARILLGLVVLYDLVVRWTSVQAFMLDSGVWTGVEAKAKLPIPWVPSLHCFHGSLEWQGVLFLLHGAVGLGILLGWRTRLLVPICWYLTISLHFRNEAILNGGDYFLRALLFWLMFLPLSTHYSLDRKAGRVPPDLPPVIANMATAGLYLQVVVLYWGAAMSKPGPVWVDQHRAIYYALHLDAFATPFGAWLRQHEAILPWLTRGSLGIEWGAPLLLILGRKRLRALGLLLLASLHVGIILCLQVGLFWIIPLIALMALVPTSFKDGPTREVALHPALNVLLGGIMLLQPYLNLYAFRPQMVPLPMSLYYLVRVSGFHYGWNMFARVNENVDGWYVIEANLKDGTSVDLLTGEHPTLDKPPQGKMYPNQRWRRFMLDLYRADQQEQAKALTRYLKRRWEAGGGSEVQNIVFHYVAERTPYPFEVQEPEDQVLFRLTFGSPKTIPRPQRQPVKTRPVSPLPRPTPPKKASTGPGH